MSYGPATTTSRGTGLDMECREGVDGERRGKLNALKMEILSTVRNNNCPGGPESSLK